MSTEVLRRAAAAIRADHAQADPCGFYESEARWLEGTRLPEFLHPEPYRVARAYLGETL